MKRYKIFSQQYGDLIMLKYYENLSADNKKTNMQDRKRALRDSDASTRRRYVELTDLEEPTTLYASLSDDKDQIVLRRWRLSSYKLFLETGRYKRPKVPNEGRKCKVCDLLEDEEHALYSCNVHQFIRI